MQIRQYFYAIVQSHNGMEVLETIIVFYDLRCGLDGIGFFFINNNSTMSSYMACASVECALRMMKGFCSPIHRNVRNTFSCRFHQPQSWRDSLFPKYHVMWYSFSLSIIDQVRWFLQYNLLHKHHDHILMSDVYSFLVLSSDSPCILDM